MKIAMGSDHAGFTLKDDLKKFVESVGHEVIDVGLTHARGDAGDQAVPDAGADPVEGSIEDASPPPPCIAN